MDVLTVSRLKGRYSGSEERATKKSLGTNPNWRTTSSAWSPVRATRVQRVVKIFTRIIDIVIMGKVRVGILSFSGITANSYHVSYGMSKQRTRGIVRA